MREIKSDFTCLQAEAPSTWFSWWAAVAFFVWDTTLDRAKLDTIIAIVNRVLGPAGYECIEAEWSGGDRILRLFVDLAAGNITLDDCVKASRLLEELPDLDAATPPHYTLEVSSPGVERPLRRRQHFERHLGERVQVRLRGKVQERRGGTGRLVEVETASGGVDDALITLETEQGVWSFPLASLQHASLVYDWDAG